MSYEMLYISGVYHFNSGFRVSIQASVAHYCIPRNDKGPWTHMELGFPNQPEPLIYSYIDACEEEDGKVEKFDHDKGDFVLVSIEEVATEQVYSCVPISVLEQLREKHGGIKHIVPRQTLIGD